MTYEELARAHGMTDAFRLFADYVKVTSSYARTVLALDSSVYARIMIRDPNDDGFFVPRWMWNLPHDLCFHAQVVARMADDKEFRAAVSTICYSTQLLRGDRADAIYALLQLT